MGSLWVWTSDRSWAYKQRRRSKGSKSRKRKNKHDSHYQTLTSFKLPSLPVRLLTLSATVRLESGLQVKCWLEAEQSDWKQGNTIMAPPNAGSNQLKQSLMLKTKSWIESWFEELHFLVIQGWSCSWGVQFESVWRCECVGWWNVCVEVGLLDYRTVFSGGPHSPPVTFGVNETGLNCDNKGT